MEVAQEKNKALLQWGGTVKETDPQKQGAISLKVFQPRTGSSNQKHILSFSLKRQRYW